MISRPSFHYPNAFGASLREAGRFIGSAILLPSLLLATNIALATEPVSKSRFWGVAIGGHDTTAYHELEPETAASEGASDHTVRYKGAKWRFASAESAAAFRADPDKYSPAYNGFCANALSLGEGLVKTDGTYWVIFDDQLYLFFAERGRERWDEGDRQSYKKEADAAWNRLKH